MLIPLLEKSGRLLLLPLVLLLLLLLYRYWGSGGNIHRNRIDPFLGKIPRAALNWRWKGEVVVRN